MPAKNEWTNESWKPILFWGLNVKVEVPNYKNSAGVGLCTLVSTGFFWFFPQLFWASELRAAVRLTQLLTLSMTIFKDKNVTR